MSKILAILDINEEMLEKTGHTFEDEMMWLSESGISMNKYKDISGYKDYEYQAFAWDIIMKKMVPINYPTHTEELCKARLNEEINSGYFPSYLDPNKVQIRKRLVHTFFEYWEDV